MALSKQIVHLKDFQVEAEELRSEYGKTERFKTGIASLDYYLGGGYGRHKGYEIVVLFGVTGIGKTTVGLNLIAQPVRQGDKIGLMMLEDDGADIFLKFEQVMGKEKFDRYVLAGDNIHCMPPDALVRSWKLEELLELIEEWFTKRNLDIILLDHLQFAFEGAESIRGENEWIAQRVFMQKLNQLIKRLKKTIIIVNHTSKNAQAKGLDKIVGSSAIAAAATKVIEVYSKDGDFNVHLWKTRFTRGQTAPLQLKLDNSQLGVLDGKFRQPF